MSTSINLNGIDQLTLNFEGTTTAVLSASGRVTVGNTLPIATTSATGVVKPDGTTITIAMDGTITSVSSGGSVPASAKALASNSSSTIIAATLAGTGAAIVTGPSVVVNGNIPSFTGSTGQIQDSGISLSSLIQTSSNNILTGQNQFRNNQAVSNVTASTSGSNNSSYTLSISGTYFAGISVTDSWTIQNVVGSGTNPTSTLTLSHTGSSGASSVSVPNLQLTNATTSTSATTGSATSLPVLPLGYITLSLNGSNVKIPYFSV